MASTSTPAAPSTPTTSTSSSFPAASATLRFAGPQLTRCGSFHGAGHNAYSIDPRRERLLVALDTALDPLPPELRALVALYSKPLKLVQRKAIAAAADSAAATDAAGAQETQTADAAATAHQWTWAVP